MQRAWSPPTAAVGSGARLQARCGNATWHTLRFRRALTTHGNRVHRSRGGARLAAAHGMGLALPFVRAESHHPALATFRRTQGEGPRRMLNVVVAAVGIMLTLPVMLLVAAVVRLTSRGPVIYTQSRVGLDRRALTGLGGNTRRHFDCGGRLFTIYKFRTMYATRTSGRPEVWATPDDARLTPLGRILRRLRLDELPQLFNVLRGDMNVVGPRPEQPTIFVALRVQIEGYQRRQRVRPGITGWAQVNRGYDRSVDDVRAKLALDLEYIRRQSALEDLKVMLRTVPVMLLARGS